MKLTIFTFSASSWANWTLKLCLDILLQKKHLFQLSYECLYQMKLLLSHIYINLSSKISDSAFQQAITCFLSFKKMGAIICAYENNGESNVLKTKNTWIYPHENYREDTTEVNVPTNYPFTDLHLKFLTWVNDTAQRQSERPTWLSTHQTSQLSSFFEEFCSYWSFATALSAVEA